jgi:hypothetical protein
MTKTISTNINIDRYNLIIKYNKSIYEFSLKRNKIFILKIKNFINQIKNKNKGFIIFNENNMHVAFIYNKNNLLISSNKIKTKIKLAMSPKIVCNILSENNI